MVVIENFAWWDIQNNCHVLALAVVQWLLNCPSRFTYRPSGCNSWPVCELISFWFCWLWRISLSTQETKDDWSQAVLLLLRYMIMYLCVSCSQKEGMKILVKVTFPVSSQDYWWQTCFFYLSASTITNNLLVLQILPLPSSWYSTFFISLKLTFLLKTPDHT